MNRLLNGTATGMSEVLSYDAVGNIKSMNRDAGGLGTYNYSGNQLSNITGGPLATGNYSYNANGSTTVDGRTGISLTYNLLNLPVTATRSATAPIVNLTYSYDAEGQKLRKVNTGASPGTRHYIDGIEYNADLIDIIKTEEGFARNNAGTFSYEYSLSDHLGNVRQEFNQHPTTGILTKIQEVNYYPFGKQKVVSAGPNKYLYNGKEVQDELSLAGVDGQYDYGARFYDPVTGRLSVVNPKAELDRKTSPYAYAFDDPIRHTDPDGMFGEDVNEDYDQEGPGKGTVVPIAPGIGTLIWEGIKDIGSGLLQGAKFGVSVSTVAVTGTVALVLLPTEAGRGSDKPPRPVLPPPLIPPTLKKDHNTNGVKSKLEPDPKAGGDHSALKRDKDGKLLVQQLIKKTLKIQVDSMRKKELTLQINLITIKKLAN